MAEQESRLAIVIDTAGAEARIKALKEQLKALGGAADNAADDTGDLGNRADRASRDTNRLNASAESGKKALDGMAKAAALAGVALAGAIGLSVNKAMSFESAMAEVNKTVDFASSDGLANMRKELQALTTEIPQTFEELAGVAAVAGQLGIAEKDIVGFTETIAKMGVAFDMSSADAADSMAKIANIFAIPIENIGQLGDTINTLSNSMASTAPGIIDFISRTASLGKMVGLSSDKVAAYGSAMLSLGMTSETSATAFNALLLKLANLDGMTDNQYLSFVKLGTSVEDFQAIMGKNPEEAINLFLESINKLSQAQKIPVLAEFIGADHAAKIASMATGLETVNGALAATADSAGSMDAEVVKITNTTANKMVMFKSNIDGVVASLGEAFIPALNELLINMTPIVTTIGEWVAANPELIQQITLIGGSLLGTIIGLKLAVDGFTAAKTTIDGLKLGFAALNNPVGLTIIALGAVLAVGVLVYKNWDEIKQVVKDNEVAFALAAIAIGAVTSAILVAKAPMIFAAAQSWAMAAGATAWTGAATIAAGATWAFNAALAVLTSPITLVVAAIGLIAYMGYQVVKNWGAISAGLRAEFERIKAAVMSAVNGMQAAWDRGVANTRAAFIAIGNTISTTLKALPAKMLSIGKDIVTGLINGIKSGASGVTSAISGMASSAVAKAKSVLDIRSPSRVMKKVGEQTAEGMAVGIKKGAKVVKSEAQKMAEGAIEAVQTGIDRIKKELSLFGNNSNLADLEYDIKVGKYNGASDAKKTEYRNAVAELEAKTKLASANKSVQDSIDGLMKQQALFGNSSALASLMYDIEHTGKYKDATEELTTKLKEQTRALEQLGMTAKATAAIQARFAQLKKDKESSKKAVAGVMTELVNESPMAKIEADYARRLEIIRTNEMLETGIIGAEVEKRLAIEQSYQDAKRDLLLTQGEALFGSLADLSKGFLGEQSKTYKLLYGIQKGFAIASAGIALWQSVSEASKAPIPAKWGLMAAAAADGAKLVSTITSLAPKGFKQGGYTGNMGVNQVAGAVHGQEYVFDAQATKRIGVDNLNAMRSGKAANDATNVNVTVNNHTSAKVETQTDSNGNIIMTIREEIKKSWGNTGNPNSFESKQLNRNVQAPRRR